VPKRGIWKRDWLDRLANRKGRGMQDLHWGIVWKKDPLRKFAGWFEKTRCMKGRVVSRRDCGEGEKRKGSREGAHM
jgi:hypothetical protein